MNLRIITKNHAADPEIGLLAKLISKSNGCATAMPTAWELTLVFELFNVALMIEVATNQNPVNINDQKFLL